MTTNDAAIELGTGDHTKRARTGGRTLVWFAGSASLLAHLVLLLVLGFLVLEPPARIGGVSGSAEPAVLAQSEVLTGTQSDLASEAPSVDASSLDRMLSDAGVSLEAGSAVESLEARLDVPGGGSDGAESFGVGGTAAGGGTKFFGVEAVGTHFAFVVDVSGSMSPDKLDSLKEELIAAIRALFDGAHVAVILFSSGPIELSGSGWTELDTSSRDTLAGRIDAIKSGGGTAPLGAFESLFQRSPGPDAVYFMTDGAFGDEQQTLDTARSILQMRRRAGSSCTIHTMTFIDHSASEAMRLIARRTGGQYRPIGSATP